MFIWQVILGVVCGNTVVSKVSELGCLSCLYLCKLLNEAGFPNGVINVIPGYGNIAGEYLVNSPAIDKIAYTGSTMIGQQIYKNASKNLTKITLELGGKAPCLVFDDMKDDLDELIPQLIDAVYWCSGQSCTALSRLYIHKDIYNIFIDKMLSAMQNNARIVDDPFHKSTNMGPIQNKKHFNKILEMIDITKTENKGGNIIYGGNDISSKFNNKGYWMEPTMVIDCNESMHIHYNEIFGPVMQIYKFNDLNDGILKANDTKYGLASGAFTKNINNINECGLKLKAGNVWLNTWEISDATMPFGGYKNSGFGRVKGFDSRKYFTKSKHIIY